MYRKWVSMLYAWNLVVSAVFMLVTPIGFAVLCSWLLTAKCGVDNWIYAVLILLGVGIGLVSMVRFLLKTSRLLHRAEQGFDQNGDTKGKDV